jgi:hypothetical protein
MSQTPERSSLRVSDADRERTVNALRAHAAAGRLEPEELEERVGGALSARTVSDLEALTADLPVVPAHRSSPGRALGRRDFQEHLRAFVAVNALLIAIWALTGFGYFWPIWPLLGWGVGLLADARCTPRRSGRRSGSLAVH